MQVELPVTRTWSREEVVQHTVQSKRERVRNAFRQYDQRGYWKKDAYIKMFVKHEKAEDDPVKPNEIGDPRAIQYRTFMHTALFKQELLPVEVRLWKYGQSCEPRSPNCERMFSKNLNPRAVAKNLWFGWSQFADPVAHLWDVSRMDAHMHGALRELIEFPTYRHHNRRVESFLQAMRRNKCFSKNGVVYEMDYTMCSGEACTSSGDSIVMAAALKYIYRNVRHHLLVCGDDSVVVLERNQEHAIDDCFEALGLPVKLEKAYLFEHVEFCQSRPVMIGGDWLMVRNPRRAILRGFHCIKNFTGKALGDWLASVGVGELESSAGVPVVQKFAEVCMRFGSPRKHFVQEYLEHRRTCGWKVPAVVTSEARHSLWLAWGISLSEQTTLEEALDRAYRVN
jgi:hypothetical protein